MAHEHVLMGLQFSLLLVKAFHYDVIAPWKCIL